MNGDEIREFDVFMLPDFYFNGVWDVLTEWYSYNSEGKSSWMEYDVVPVGVMGIVGWLG